MINVSFETTPNPHSMKYVISQQISEESCDFKTIQDAERSPLAKKLFGFPWADSIFLGTDFLTVTKQDWVDWDIIATPLANLIQEHLENGEPVLVELAEKISSSSADLEINENDTSVVQQIKTIIKNEIKPAVAMDGGDIQFVKYENNIVYIYMLGACAGCPSSTMTLKQGIETRLVDAIPEIKEVISLN